MPMRTTTIATAAIAVNFPKQILQASRKPSIMADAAYAIFVSSAKETTGNFFIDEDLLRMHGVTDFNQYALNPGTPLMADFFLD